MVFKIIFLIILVIVNGIFSATEMAFLSLSKYELNKELKKNNKKASKILSLLNDSSTFLSAIQIAITLSGFLASAFAAESFASEIADVLTISFLTKETLTTILIILITMVLSYFTLVFGELVPKRIGLTYSKKIAFSMVTMIDIVIIIFKPFIILLRASTELILKLLHVNKVEENNEDEIKNSIISADLEELEKKLLLNVFEFNDTTLDCVMTKKDDVIYLDINSNADDIMRVIKDTKYTRFPVIDDGEVVGVLNIKDLLVQPNESKLSIREYMREIEALPSNMIIDDAFLYLNSEHLSIAKVVKDGEWVGIVTVEDIVEEIIGNIFDEYDIV